MSRIGYQPINLPTGVEVTIDHSTVVISGPKGKLSLSIQPLIKVEIVGGKILVKRAKEDKQSKSLHGLTRALLNNMVVGVTEGWKKDLELVGIGYRAAATEDGITLNVGLSHPVNVKAPEGITFAVLENTKISVSGIDRNLVGQVAANLRAIKPPEVYKGKGIRYVGEYVRKKPGKAGKALGVAGGTAK